MVEEHTEGSEAPRRVSRDVIAKRKRNLLYVMVMTPVLAAGLIFFVTVENTEPEDDEQRSNINVADVESSASDPAIGKELWGEFLCQDCHQEDGRGVAPSPAIVGTALPGLEDFVLAIRTGPSDMPVFTTSEVSDEEIAHLYAYLQTLE
jgi:mono/diheme cytochrome c family protein